MKKRSRQAVYFLLVLLLILSNTAISATPLDVPGSLASDAIDPTSAGFDKEIANQSDILINLSVDGNALREIRNGTYILKLDADYSVAHKTVTINKSYLAKQPAGTTVIDFIFKSGKHRTLNIDIAPAASAISPVKVGFDKNKASQADIRLEMVLNGNTLSAVMNGTAVLVSGTDYTVTDNAVTINKSYLANQPVGTTTLSFKFNEGPDQALVIEISDTTPGFVSMPIPAAPYYTMTNGSFEAGKSAWGEYIANGAAAPEVTADAKEGAASIKLDNKTGGFTSMWNTTLPVNKQKNMPAAGDLIQVGAWVKVGSGADTSKSFRIQIDASDSSDKKTTILNTPSLAGIQADTWVYVVSSPAQIPEGTAYLAISFQDEMPGAIQIDDVKVFHYPPTYALGNGSFENTLSAWGQDNSNNAAAISTVSDAKEGTASVKLVNTASSKASIWNSTLQINGQSNMPAVGDVIQVGAWIKVGTDADTSKQFILKAEGFDGTNKALVSYITSLAGLKPDTWTFVLAPAAPVPAGQTAITVAVEDSVPGTVQVDGIRVFHYPAAYAMTNGNFETAKNTWGEYVANGAVAPEIATDAKEGASSIKLDNKTNGFTSMWNTTLAVNGQANMPVVGDMIQIGAWVKLGADANTAKPFAIQVEADTGVNPKPLLVKTQSLAGIQADTWTYIVSGAAQIPAGTNVLAVSFQDSMPGSIQIDDVRIFNYNPPAAVKNSTISPGAVNFDKKASNQQDVSVTMTLNGNTFTGIFDGETQLVQGTDYTLTGSVIAIKKEYLAAQGTGLKKLTFKFSAGLSQTLNINIVDTTDLPVNGDVYTMVSPGFEDYITPDNDFSWGIYPTTLYGVGSNPPWNHNGFGIITDNVHGGEKALAASAGGALWQRVYQKDGVQDGDFVQTSVWVYAYPGTTGFKVQVDALDNAETHTVIAQSREIDANDQGKWVLLQTNPIKSVPLGSTKGIVIAANSQTGDIILDDFVTSRIGHETPQDNNAAFAYPQRSVYPIQNGDFEGAGTTPWGTWGTVSAAAEESYYGSKSIKFVNTTSTNTAIWQGASIGTGPNDPKVGQGVEAGLWVYFASDTDFTGKDFYIDVNAVDAGNVQTLLAKSDSITSGTLKGKWIYIKTRPVNGGMIPEGTVYVQVSVQNTVAGTVYADLIQMGETNAINGNPTKMAFFAYQPWYGNKVEGGSADWYNWAWTDSRISHDPNTILANGNRDVASALYPIVGAYSSTDTELLQYQFDIAKAAHIDGFMINDYGKEIKQDYRVCEGKMFDIADKMGMKIALQYEPKIHFAGWVPSTAALPRSNLVNGVEQGSQLRGIIDDLEYILKNYAPRKSYLKYNGLPVINPFGASLVSSSEWVNIKQTIINEGYGDFVLMADTAPSDPNKYTSFSSTYNWHMMSSATDPSKGPTYDKVYAWGIGNDKGSYDWVAGDLQNRFGVGLVFPGFNDSGVGGNWGSGTDRIAAYMAKDDPDHPWMGPADPKGDTLTATQNAVLNSKVNWVVYATFNDWNEATVVEPSEEFGYKFIIEAQNFMEQFKGLPLTEADDNLMQQITEAYIASRTAKFN